ncbi:MAG: response regulator [Myxococcales bacterium]|nr:response regulator [Myxococcales bacterium]
MSRILVVDDDKTAVDGLCGLLEMDGFDAVGLRSPEQALERLKSDEHFDALVTDLEMPKVHGLELMRTAKKTRAAMPILVITAYVGSHAAEQAVALGARRVLGKPLRYELLVEELQRCTS